MTLENTLFSWNGWDGDHECMTFYKPKLNVSIGKFPIGTEFQYAIIDYANSMLQLCNSSETEDPSFFAENVMGEYKLKLVVTETISEAS